MLKSLKKVNNNNIILNVMNVMINFSVAVEEYMTHLQRQHDHMK